MYTAIANICKGDNERKVLSLHLEKGIDFVDVPKFYEIKGTGATAYDAVDALYAIVVKLIKLGKTITFDKDAILVYDGNNGSQPEIVPVEKKSVSYDDVGQD